MSNPIKWLDRDDGPVNYGEPTYWERRYELDRKEFGTSHRHDWYFDYEKLKTTFESYFGQPRGQRILIVGCGLSTIPARMHAMGYRCITAIDISPTAVSLMQAGDQDKEGIEYVIGDARKMDSLPDNLFDGVFDKGCADSLICGYRSTEDVVDMFHECCRVLRPEGVFLCVSHGSEGLNVYVSTKWTHQEIEAAEKQRLDDIESTLSMRTGSSFSQSSRGRRPGVNFQNRIVHAMAPHELDEVKHQREKEATERTRAKAAARAEARAASTAAEKSAAESAIVHFEGVPPTAHSSVDPTTATADSTTRNTGVDAASAQEPSSVVYEQQDAT
eukprot:g9095.t1